MMYPEGFSLKLNNSIMYPEGFSRAEPRLLVCCRSMLQGLRALQEPLMASHLEHQLVFLLMGDYLFFACIKLFLLFYW